MESDLRPPLVDDLNDLNDEDVKVRSSPSFHAHRSSFIGSSRRPPIEPKKKHEEEVPSFLSTGSRHLGVEELATLLTNAVSCYYHDRGIHCSAGESWVRFFGDTDVDGSGRITFDELETAIKRRLRTGITRYQLLVLWRQLDSDHSGEVSVEEVVQFLYQVDLSSWPAGSHEDVKRAVKRLHKAGAMWYQAAGNWYKIFLQIDINLRGYITLDDLKRAVRGGFYGFRLSSQELPDEEIHKLWKALDDEAEMRVPLRKFLAFMRRMGGQQCHKKKQKLKNALKAQRSRTQVELLPELSNEEMLLGAQELVRKMAKYYGLQGSPTSLATPEVWTHLFHTIHPDGSFRIRFIDFENFASKMEVSPKMFHRIRALWRLVDADGSGEASEKEFVEALYGLQLDQWPRLEDHRLERAMALLNAHADKWHRAGGNWFKVLSICDEDGSGRLDYEELVKVIRGAYPGLKLSESILSDDELRGMWKAMDTDRSGHVSIQEFMIFARRYGSRTAKREETNLKKAEDTCHSELSEEEKLYVIRTLEGALNCYFSKRGVHGRDSWEMFFQECGADRYGRISFEKLTEGMRKKLLTLPGIESMEEVKSAVVHGVSLQDFRGLWKLSEDKAGSVSSKDWALNLYRMELNSWPKPVESILRSTARSLKLRADRIHQSPDNWYRVFCVATENLPNMSFAELKFIVRLNKTPGLSLSPRELPLDRLRMLWRAMDSGRTGLVHRGSFIAFMRRFAAPKVKPPQKDRTLEVRDARKLLADGLSDVGVESLRDALESWGAEWTGYVSEWDWQHIARQLLEYSEETLSDDALHGVWEELDHKNEGELEAEELLERLSMQSRLQKVSGSTTLTELLRPGTESTHAPSTARSVMMSTPVRTPGLTGLTAPPGVPNPGIETPTGEQPEESRAPPPLSRLATQTALISRPSGVFSVEQDPALRMVAERLAEALMGYLRAKGVHCSTTIAGWHRFFSEMDADNSGRATFDEMEDAFQRCLRHARVSRYELLMLWRRLDADGSGEVSLDEFVKMMYRYELAMWPRSSDAELSRVVKMVSAAISRWHHVEGNWYKVYLFIDTQGTGTITFEDLQQFLRGTYPGLHLDREEMPSDDMFRLWKALDTRAQMRVPKSQFMSFMRRYGGHWGKSTTKTSKEVLPKTTRETLCPTPKKMPAEESGQARIQSFTAAMRRKQSKASRSPAWTTEEEEAARSIMDRLSDYSVEHLMMAYDKWGLPWTGVVSEWEWQLLVRRLLAFEQDSVDDTLVHSFWTCIDQHLTGYVAAGDLLQMMRMGQRQVKQPRQDLTSFEPPHPDAHASAKQQKQEKMFIEATYWRSAWWTSHLRHAQGLLPKVLAS